MALEYTLTNKQIDPAVDGRKFSSQVIEIAKRIMVDGWSPAQTAEAYNLNRSRVYAIRDQVWAAHVEASMYPPDWKTVTLMASPELIEKFTKLAEKERQKWLASK